MYVPGSGTGISTCSTLLRRSALPPVVEAPPENTFPRNVPEGPATVRSRSFTSRAAVQEAGMPIMGAAGGESGVAG